jgi:hypothetical protein
VIDVVAGWTTGIVAVVVADRVVNRLYAPEVVLEHEHRPVPAGEAARTA